MRIVLFSDLHAHSFKPYAMIRDDGMNSRLADAISIIRQVQKVAEDEDADLVLFGGDMFHVRRHIAVRAFNAVYEAMAAFSLTTKIPIVLIHGNHDQADKQGNDYSLFAFNAFCTVIAEPDWYHIPGKNSADLPLKLCAVPYMENRAHLRDIIQGGTTVHVHSDCPTMFLGHLGIQGAKVGADFVYVNPHDPDVHDLHMDTFDVGFLGHYHEHQALPISSNFWYIGAPMHHTWGDRHEQMRGCIVYDTETKGFHRVPLQFPKFVQMHRDHLVASQFKDNYVRIVDSAHWSVDEIEDFRQAQGARSLEIVPPVMTKPKTAMPRLEVKPGMSYQDLVETYIRSGLAPAEDLDSDYLMMLGRELLEEAGDA